MRRSVRKAKSARKTHKHNAYVERFVQTLKQECRDHFIVLGEEHLRYLAAEFVLHYNEERPHQSNGNLPLGMAKPPDGGSELGQLVIHERLGGLLKHYYRKAA